ncbi:hypothetical protein MMG00_03950 [Ignatzschineria rhizosphaerae]|uniref:Fimbrial-type adhesion domain-containing protein n=1 Tax=Ignatzschineria rhizosphaerae TaxID=2923279 RepID=A0ABY3X2A6_9GAMM|nr:hypothetical protein [Ignatzschineria rhizosphaerae]UNM97013.1 hypothetical protein MMG00_03950 [Ignatzschineria rhizosphaerae]
MKKLSLLLITLLASVNMTPAQDHSSFEINGEILPESFCQISAPDISFGEIEMKDLEKPGGKSITQLAFISLYNCSINLPEGGTISSLYLEIEPGEPSPNEAYWSILNKPNANLLAIKLIEPLKGRLIRPSTGTYFDFKATPNQQVYQAFFSAQIINIAEGEIETGSFSVPINVTASFY